MSKNNNFHILRNLVYIVPEVIESIYTQLTENSAQITIEKDKNTSGILTPKLSDFFKIFSLNYSSETKYSKREISSHDVTLEEKFIKVLEAIGEKEYKDIFYIIEKHMIDSKQIYVIGKGRFDHIYFEHNIGEISFDVKSLLINYNEKTVIYGTNNKMHSYSSDIDINECYIPSCKKMPKDCKKVYMVIDNKYYTLNYPISCVSIIDKYFLGTITCFDNNYILTPYAVWGEYSLY